mgnify:FL=1
MSDIDKIYYEEMFKDYRDVVKPVELKEMLGFGTNKTYKLLKNQEIYNKRIGNNYIIPKISVIEYLIKN